jgi:hypothetical protein
MNKKDVMDSPETVGRRLYLKNMNNEKITIKQRVIAKCFECSNGYIDGRVSCEIKDCPLFPYMPYKRAKK